MDLQKYNESLEKYGVLFCFRIYEDIKLIESIGLKFSQLDRAKSFMSEISDIGIDVVNSLTETGLEPTPDLVSAAYRSQPQFKVNMMFAMAMSKLLYGSEERIMNVFEFVTVRSLCIQCGINSDCSVQSHIINSLEIPVDAVPAETVAVSRTLDEYIKAVNFIETEIDKIDGPDSCSDLEQYRDVVSSRAGIIIHDANAAGFYGTYPEHIFIELIMLRKLSPQQYPTLYGTPKLPRWEVAYDELKQIVLNAWRIRNGE